MFATAKKLAGIDPEITLHGLRQGYVSNLLDMGASIVEVKALLNHKSITTTPKYLHAKDERLIARTQKLSKKYQQPT
jgi:site-specific recombinase XerD